ncbi:GDSL esterase/lipase At1g28570-like [Phragmites australis]|uniref:GDSL esterase/lipase At1g28570-like n=1 Tax=Phragmites australis TaxID=29695 RepID=UPI002D76B4A1|nr:GDSL esterase/lipase At1g28570-like [Phragmites australis]
MAMSSRVLIVMHLLVAACAVLGSSSEEPRRGGCFTGLFSFGDSITDNGNWLRYARSPGAVSRPPYGETFFRRPNGRFCDGRIIIDHVGAARAMLSSLASSFQLTTTLGWRAISYVLSVTQMMCPVYRAADALGIPFLTPYLAGNSSEDYAHGANFAVGGATALGHEYFRGKNLDVRFTPYSLRWQMSWLKEVLRMLSSEQGWSDLMESSLFLVGEIGGNDYNQALFQGRSVDEVRTYVPDVVAGISASLVELIGLGAKTVVVPGNFPIGCNPGYLTKFQTNDTAQYDSMGCLKWPNGLTQLHNRALKAELAELGRRHPGVAVVYADYYAAAMDLTADPRKHGGFLVHAFVEFLLICAHACAFTLKRLVTDETVRIVSRVPAGFDGKPLVSCCGGGGPYNANPTVHCGMRTSTTCHDPYEAVSWDGFHFTDHAYKVIANGVLRGPYAMPPILAKCRRRRR